MAIKLALVYQASVDRKQAEKTTHLQGGQILQFAVQVQ